MPLIAPRALRHALAHRVVVADGAMGTMLQAQAPTLDDFQGLDGCNEVLNVSRPDIVRRVHDAYFAVGVDCVETNTFGANYANLGEYDAQHRIRELAEAGARLAREVADGYATDEHPRWVIGSVGPGTKLPSLGHAPFALLRDAYAAQVEAMVDGGVDAVLVETAQDLLQAKAALIGARRAMTSRGVSLPLIVNVTVETTGTMLLGSEIGAALTALEPLGIDLIGLNCATGPTEMSEHLRHLSRHATIGLSCMPNAGLPVLGPEGAHYPLSGEELADAHDVFTREYGLSLVGGCCGTTPEHLGLVVERVQGRPVPGAAPDQRARRCFAVRERAVPAGHVLPVHRGTYERQRFTRLPGRDARGALGHLRRDRPRADPRRRAPARRVHRLRRPRRSRRHARGRQAGWRPPARCRSCSTRPSPR